MFVFSENLVFDQLWLFFRINWGLEAVYIMSLKDFNFVIISNVTGLPSYNCFSLQF